MGAVLGLNAVFKGTLTAILEIGDSYFLPLSAAVRIWIPNISLSFLELLYTTS